MQGNLSGLKREVQELSTLFEIAKALNSSLDLKVTLQSILEILKKKMDMHRATVTLLDEKSRELIIEAAYGMTPEAIKRGRYKIGEGITGKVVETGEPMFVQNVGDEPHFLNRTGSRGDIQKENISFICVPIKIDRKTVGTLSVDRLFTHNIALQEDERLLTIISSMISQAVRISQMVEREKEALLDENRMLRNELRERYRFENIVGESKKMQDIYHTINLVAPTKATVLLRGESGTGKELIARAIHYNSPRRDKPFIKFSCAALPETLIESELFGYEKGAFTGANASKQGRFELANGGTIFLDEIGDINLTMQIKLLRVLQEREFERVGGVETVKVDVRVIAATNKDLEQAVREGKFREDLYYRLNVLPIFLPPLRDRKEDIPLLAEHFIRLFSKENEKEIQGLTKRAWDCVHNFNWPGNIRELENCMERAVIVCQKNVIDAVDLPAPLQNSNLPQRDEGPATLPAAVESVERRMIREALQQTGGNRRKAAQILGVTERILGYKLKSYPEIMA
jgi:Nif-specific regulatory protein